MNNENAPALAKHIYAWHTYLAESSFATSYPEAILSCQQFLSWIFPQKAVKRICIGGGLGFDDDTSGAKELRYAWPRRLGRLVWLMEVVLDLTFERFPVALAGLVSVGRIGRSVHFERRADDLKRDLDGLSAYFLSSPSIALAFRPGRA